MHINTICTLHIIPKEVDANNYDLHTPAKAQTTLTMHTPHYSIDFI